MTSRTAIMHKYETKTAKGWVETYRTTDPAEVNRSFASAMLSKMLGATYIKRVSVDSNYDDTYTVTIYEDDGTRRGRRTFVIAR